MQGGLGIAASESDVGQDSLPINLRRQAGGRNSVGARRPERYY